MPRRAESEDEQDAQLRGAMLQGPQDRYLPLADLALYAGISVRKLRDLITDPVHALPCYRVGGKVLVRRSEFDEWMRRYRKTGATDLDQIADEIVNEVIAGPSKAD